MNALAKQEELRNTIPTITPNRSRRSQQAAVDIVKANLQLAGMGYVALTRGSSAGRNGYFNVYVYRMDDVAKLTDSNDRNLAVFDFQVNYQKGPWFMSDSHVGEGMASGLIDACEALASH